MSINKQLICKCISDKTSSVCFSSGLFVGLSDVNEWLGGVHMALGDLRPTVKCGMAEFYTEFWILLFRSCKSFYAVNSALSLWYIL